MNEKISTETVSEKLKMLEAFEKLTRTLNEQIMLVRKSSPFIAAYEAVLSTQNIPEAGGIQESSGFRMTHPDLIFLKTLEDLRQFCIERQADIEKNM